MENETPRLRSEVWKQKKLMKYGFPQHVDKAMQKAMNGGLLNHN